MVSRLGENDWHEVDFRSSRRPTAISGAHRGAASFGADLYERLAIVADPAAAAARAPRGSARSPRTSWSASLARSARRRRGATDSRRRARRARRRTLAGQHPRAAQRDLRDARLQARRSEILLSDLPRAHPRRPRSGDGRRPCVDRRRVARKIATARCDLQARRRRLERWRSRKRCTLAAATPRRRRSCSGRVGRGAARDPGGTVRAMMRRLGLEARRSRRSPPRR